MLKIKKNKQNNLIALGVSCVALVLLGALIASNIGGNDEITGVPPEIDVVEIQADADEIDTEPRPATTRRPSVNKAAQTAPPLETMAENPPEFVEAPLAPVFVPDEEVRAILEERNVEVAPVNPPTPQAQPAPEEQQSPNEVTYIDGQKYVWNNVLGWIKDSEDGYVIIMDVESNGESYEGGW